MKGSKELMKDKAIITVKDLNLYYGVNHALKNVSMDIYENKITAFIGPSGCGKSTFLKTLNRMNDLVDGVKIDGTIEIDGEDIAKLKEKKMSKLRLEKIGFMTDIISGLFNLFLISCAISSTET